MYARVLPVAVARGTGVIGIGVAGRGVATIGRGVGATDSGATDSTGGGSVVAIGVTSAVLAIGASGEVVAGTAVASAAASDRSGLACSTAPDAVPVQAPAMTAAITNVSGLTLP
jgi:hypothetical protein